MPPFRGTSGLLIPLTEGLSPVFQFLFSLLYYTGLSECLTGEPGELFRFDRKRPDEKSSGRSLNAVPPELQTHTMRLHLVNSARKRLRGAMSAELSALHTSGGRVNAAPAGKLLPPASHAPARKPRFRRQVMLPPASLAFAVCLGSVLCVTRFSLYYSSSSPSQSSDCSVFTGIIAIISRKFFFVKCFCSGGVSPRGRGRASRRWTAVRQRGYSRTFPTAPRP